MIYSCVFCFFFFKQKTAYEMRISDWSSDVCSSDLSGLAEKVISADQAQYEIVARATEHVVDADTTIQRVSVRTAVEPILTRSAVESVLPVATEQNVIAFLKENRDESRHLGMLMLAEHAEVWATVAA